MSESDVFDKNSENTSNEFVENGTNKLVVKCKFCGSKILDKKFGVYIEQEVKYIVLKYQYSILLNILSYI